VSSRSTSEVRPLNARKAMNNDDDISSLGKYEFKRFIARSTVETSRPEPTQALSNQLPPAPQTKTAPARFMSVAPQSLHPPRGDSLGYRPSTSSGGKPTVSKPSQTQPNRSVSQPLPSQPPTHAPPPPPKPSNPVWDDLISLQGPSASSSLPLQFQPNSQPSAPSQPMLISNANPIGLQMTNPATFSQPSGGLGMGSTHTGVGMDPSIGIGGTNPFQQQQSNFTTTAFLPASGPSPGPNPFPQSYLSPGMTAAANPFAGMSGQSMPQSSPFHSQIQPFSQTAAAQQFQASLQSQSQSQSYFQPQPQPAQQQAPQQPFGQQPSPFATQQPSPYGQQQPSPFGQQPSPFGHQPSPQLQQPPQQQQQQMLSPGNPFGVWQQQPGGYSGQQWGGM
jgi:stromal membrane-associated protein